MIRRASVVTGALVAAVLLSACGSTTPKPTIPDGLRGKSGPPQSDNDDTWLTAEIFIQFS